MTVCSLVRAGLGVAVVDQFTVAHDFTPGIKILRIAEPTPYDNWVATKIGAPTSIFAKKFITLLRTEMQGAVEPQRIRA